MLLQAGRVRTLGSATPRLSFARDGNLLLLLDQDPAFDLSYSCSSCPFLFQRLPGANRTLSVDVDGLQSRLTVGLDHLDDDVVTSFAALLQRGKHLPLLLSVQPTLTLPGRPGDYFCEEQVASWGVANFWGLPEYPATPYYRAFETPVDAGTHLFEFVVPMVPPTWNDPAQVAEHAHRLASSDRPPPSQSPPSTSVNRRRRLRAAATTTRTGR